jgi:transposase
LEPNQTIPAREVERMMKLQDVLLKAMANKISWASAAEIIGVTPRTMRRWRARLEKNGYSGLRDGRKGKPSFRRVPLTTCQRVLRLYQETYFDFNVRHFHEKLGQDHAIKLSYTWVKQALQGAGLVARKKKRGTHRRRRPRREMPGMLLHIDGSKHRWFQDARYYDLIVILDDATSRIYYAQLVAEESTLTVMAGIREVIETEGMFCALYSDRGSHFFYTPKAGEPVDKSRRDAARAGVEGTGRANDSGLFATGARTQRAQLRNLAGAASAGAAAARDRLRGGSQSLSARGLHRGVQRAVHREGGPARHCLSQVRAARSGWGVFHSNGTRGGEGQHRGYQDPPLADRQVPLAL